MMSMNLHDVASIQTDKREDLSCGTIVRSITVTTESGERVQLHLYSKKWENLTVRGDKL